MWTGHERRKKVVGRSSSDDYDSRNNCGPRACAAGAHNLLRRSLTATANPGAHIHHERRTVELFAGDLVAAVVPRAARTRYDQGAAGQSRCCRAHPIRLCPFAKPPLLLSVPTFPVRQDALQHVPVTKRLGPCQCKDRVKGWEVERRKKIRKKGVLGSHPTTTRGMRWGDYCLE